MNTIGSVILFSVMLIIVFAFLVAIIKAEDKDRGCDFDCKTCPFPKCSKERKDRMQRKLNDLHNRRYPR